MAFASFLLILSIGYLALVSGQTEQEKIWEERTCCRSPDLGCFPITGEFSNFKIRLTGNSVVDCTLIGRIHLRLNTRQNPSLRSLQILDPYNVTTIKLSNFSPRRPTKILIHGFLDVYATEGWETITKNLLQDDDYNVVRMDWAQGNRPVYTQSVANIRLVGAYVAKFIHVIISEFDAKAKDVHIIGHSLGAHGAGYAGLTMKTRYNMTIGRISGLDPAGLYFTSMPINVRLDPTDAEIVDTIITDADTSPPYFGSSQPMGHLNFYPNGGSNQPGCEATTIRNHVKINAAQKSKQTRKRRDVEAKINGSLSWDNISVIENASASFANNTDPNLQDELSSYEALEEYFNQEREAEKKFRVTSLAVSFSDPFTGLLGTVMHEAKKFQTVSCSHGMAVRLFADTVLQNSSCLLQARECDSYDKYLRRVEGSCSTHATCAAGLECGKTRIGLHINPILAVKTYVRSFFTATTAKAPFCPNLRVTVKLQATSIMQPANKANSGTVFLVLQGTGGEAFLKGPEDVDLTPGESYHFYPTESVLWNSIDRITLTWTPKTTWTPGARIINLFAGRPTIFLDGDITVTNDFGTVYYYTPATLVVGASQPVTAVYTRQQVSVPSG